ARDIDFAFGRYNLLERSRIHHRPMRLRIAMWTIKEKPDVRIEQKVVFRAETVFLDSLRFHPSLVQGLPDDSVYSIWVLEILLSCLDHPSQKCYVLRSHSRHRQVSP